MTEPFPLPQSLLPIQIQYVNISVGYRDTCVCFIDPIVRRVCLSGVVEQVETIRNFVLYYNKRQSLGEVP